MKRLGRPSDTCHQLRLDQYGHLLLQWQEHRSDNALSELLRLAHPLIEGVARQALHDAGIGSNNFLDDTLSLVADHLRRLPGTPLPDAGPHRNDLASKQRRVMAFAPKPGQTNPGRRFLTWLTRRRAADVARQHRRRCHLAGSFSECNPDRLQRAVADAALNRFADRDLQQRQHERIDWLHSMLNRLEPHDRLLMELCLEGKTLAVIAHVLGCCEGTVCRRRQRIEQWLREAVTPASTFGRTMKTQRCGDRERTPGPPAPAGRPGRGPASRHPAQPEPSARPRRGDRPESRPGR
jgi:RNA polymerase sigma factor (sigma-70 family)